MPQGAARSGVATETPSTARRNRSRHNSRGVPAKATGAGEPRVPCRARLPVTHRKGLRTPARAPGRPRGTRAGGEARARRLPGRPAAASRQDAGTLKMLRRETVQAPQDARIILTPRRASGPSGGRPPRRSPGSRGTRSVLRTKPTSTSGQGGHRAEDGKLSIASRKNSFEPVPPGRFHQILNGPAGAGPPGSGGGRRHAGRLPPLPARKTRAGLDFKANGPPRGILQPFPIRSNRANLRSHWRNIDRSSGKRMPYSPEVYANDQN
jgi:hypothetical protein